MFTCLCTFTIGLNPRGVMSRPFVLIGQFLNQTGAGVVAVNHPALKKKEKKTKNPNSACGNGPRDRSGGSRNRHGGRKEAKKTRGWSNIKAVFPLCPPAFSRTPRTEEEPPLSKLTLLSTPGPGHEHSPAPKLESGLGTAGSRPSSLAQTAGGESAGRGKS